MILNITSRQNEKIKYISQLNNASFRNKEGLFIVEGFHLVDMALEKGVVKTIVTLEPYSKVTNDIEQLVVPESILIKLCASKTPQGIIAICYMDKLENKVTSSKVLYLDDVQDPGNIGTIIRTALAFGFKDVILSEACCSLYNSKALAASQGSIFYLNFIKGNSSLLNELKDKGYQIVVTNLRNSVLLKDYKPALKQVIVMGNEAHGVSEEVINIASVNVRIDIDCIDSLNVGVAAGIMMNDAKERS